MIRGGARAWAPALVLLVCLVALAVAWLAPVIPSPQSTASPAPEITAPARALLGDLKEGDKIMGWTVVALDGPRDQQLRVDLERDGVRFALMVAAKGRRPQPPPVQTEHHVIFYGHAHPPDTTLPSGTIRATTHALARRIRGREGTVEVPGM